MVAFSRDDYGSRWRRYYLSCHNVFICGIFIHKIGRLTILRWDGPTTLIVNDLAKNENDNDVRLLALAEFKRLLARRPDPPASEVIVNWRQKLSDPRTLSHGICLSGRSSMSHFRKRRFMRLDGAISGESR